MMMIRGKLVKIDMGEMEGKPYGDIHIASERGNIVEVEFSGNAIRTLEKLSLISLPEKIDTTIPVTPKQSDKPERFPNAIWNKNYMGLGISTKFLDWIIMIGLVSMGVILLHTGDFLSHCYYWPETINFVRDSYVTMSFGSAIIMLICGISVGVTKQKTLSTIATTLAMIAGIISFLYWSSILTTELLVQSEEPFAELYFYVSILISLLSFIGILKNR